VFVQIWRTFYAFVTLTSNCVACRSVCKPDRSGINWLTYFLKADQGIKRNSGLANLNFSGGVATICPVEPVIKSDL